MGQANLTNPTAELLARQIAEAFPWDTVPGFLIRDNDGAYGERSLGGFEQWAFAIAPSRPDRHGRMDTSNVRSGRSAVNASTM